MELCLERMDERNRDISRDFEGLEGTERFRVMNALDVNPRCLKVSARAAEYARRECQKISQDAWSRGTPVRFCSMVTLALEYGVSERCIRGWEAELVMAGIVYRRNPRARRCGAPSGGGISFAPIAVQLDHFEAQAAQVKADIRTHADLRSRHSRVVRHILRMLDRSASFQAIAEVTATIRVEADDTRLERIYAATPLTELAATCEALEALEGALSEALAGVENQAVHINSTVMTENNDRHTELQTSSLYPTDTGNQPVNKRTRSYEHDTDSFGSPSGDHCREKSERRADGTRQPIHPDAITVDIIQPALCAASAEFTEAFSRAPGNQWERMSYAASAVLRPLGIHKSAWRDAVAMIGAERASLCVLVTDAKHRLPDNHPKHVRSPGGYLRMMSRRGKGGELKVEQSIFGLVKSNTLVSESAW